MLTNVMRRRLASDAMEQRVLIVEDEFLIRMTLFEALSDEGFDVVEAASGDDALVLLRDDPTIRLLLTDLQLPGGLDGRALALKAREAVPATLLPSGRIAEKS